MFTYSLQQLQHQEIIRIEMENDPEDNTLEMEHSYGGPASNETSNPATIATRASSDPIETEAELGAAPVAQRSNSPQVIEVEAQSPIKTKVQPRVIVLVKPSGDESKVELSRLTKSQTVVATKKVVVPVIADIEKTTNVYEKTKKEEGNTAAEEDISIETENTSIEPEQEKVKESIEQVKEKEAETEFPFVCGICQKKFSEIATFCTHVKSHENAEKYFHSCQNQKKKVLEALNIVENSELFQCGVCYSSFPMMCQLHEHMLKVEKMKDYKYSNEQQIAYPPDDDEEEERNLGTAPSSRKRKENGNNESQSVTKKRRKDDDDSGDGDDDDLKAGKCDKNEAAKETPVKRGRGRPRLSDSVKKVHKKVDSEDAEGTGEGEIKEKKRARGRPRKSEVRESIESSASEKNKMVENSEPGKTPRGRGRPRKSEYGTATDAKTPKSRDKNSDDEEEITKKGKTDADVIVSPRNNTSYGLRGQRKLNSRYNDYVTDTSWLKKEVVESENEDDKAQKELEEDEMDDIDDNESVTSNFEESLKKELAAKEKARQDKLDKAQKILMALDGTEYVAEDQTEMNDNGEETEEKVKNIKKEKKLVTIRRKKVRLSELEIAKAKLERRICDNCNEPFYLPPGITDDSKFIHKCSQKVDDSSDKNNEDADEAESFLQKNFPQTKDTCHICKKKFVDIKRLKRHVLTHLSTKNVRCNLCGKTFKLKAYLNDHKRFFHKLSASERKALDTVEYVGTEKAISHFINPSTGSYDPTFRRPCPICGKYFESKRMRRHMICHLNARNVKCDMCPKRFKCPAHMRDHKKLVHQRTILRCKVCRRVFRHYKSLERHLGQHVRKSEIENMSDYEEKYIEVVKAVSDSSSQTEKEYTKEEEEEYDDVGVDELVDQLMSLGDDLQETRAKMFIADEAIDFQYHCEYCGQRFETADDLSSHVDIHPEPKTYTCYLCEKIFHNAKLLKHHMVIHVAMHRFFCEKCGSGFKSSQRLKEHIRVSHIEGLQYICNICGDSYKSEQTLWTHKNLHLKVSNKYYSKDVEELLRQEESERKWSRIEASKYQKTITCEDCGKEVIAKRYFRHKDTHKKDRDIPCDLCSKKFTSLRYMKDHKSRTHFAQKSATCDICGLMFKATYIEKHRMIHGPKDKYCTICNKGFTTDFYLKIHMGTHEAKKRMRCPECDAGFSHKSRLDIHMIEKHGHGEPRPCKYCKQMFPSRQKARLHERKMHEGYKMPYRDKAKYRFRSLVNHNIVRSALPEGYHIEVREASEEIGEGEQMYVEQVGADGESVEHILEIPENAEQCQILLFPNGTFKVLNVDGGEEAVQIVQTEEGETIWQEATEAEVVEAAIRSKEAEGAEGQEEEQEEEQEFVEMVSGEVVEEDGDGVGEGEGGVLTVDESEVVTGEVMSINEGEVMAVSEDGMVAVNENEMVSLTPGEVVAIQNGKLVRVALGDGHEESVIVTGLPDDHIVEEVQQQVAIIADQ